MGLLDRFLKGADRVDQAAADTGQAMRDVVFNRPYVRGERMMTEGDTAIGRIVGVRRKLNDGSTRCEIAVARDELGVLVRNGVVVRTPGARKLRFGMDVPLRLDGKRRAVLDVPRLEAAFGMPTSTLLWAEPTGKVPDDGIAESALDARFAKRLKKGTPAMATVVTVTPRLAMGMPTENFDVELRLEDGRLALDRGQEIPFYALWLARPEEAVPVALSQDDPAHATVDWAVAALAARDRAGSFEDDTPPL